MNIYNSDGTLTGARTMTMAGHNLVFEGGSATNRIRMSADAGQARIFSFASANVARWAFRVDGAETGSNAGADWALRSYNDAGTFVRSPLTVTRSTGEKSLLAEASLTAGTNTFTGTYQIGGATYAAGLTMIGGNPHGAEHNNFTLANAGNLTFANSIYLGAQSNVLRLQANNSGTVTMQAASPGVRTAASTLNQVQYNTTTGAALIYTHVSVMQALGIYRLFANGSLTVTNAYGLIINDLNEYGYATSGGGALAITNRWGIYQDSTTDLNYFGGNTLFGTITSAGYKVDVNGTLRTVNSAYFATTSGNVGIGTTSPLGKFQIDTIAVDGSTALNLKTTNSAGSNSTIRWVNNLNQQTVAIGSNYSISNNGIEFIIGTTTKAQLRNNGNFLFNTGTDSGQNVQINSSLRLVPTSTVPTASAGAMYYDSATNKLKLYDGTNWVDLN